MNGSSARIGEFVINLHYLAIPPVLTNHACVLFLSFLFFSHSMEALKQKMELQMEKREATEKTVDDLQV